MGTDGSAALDSDGYIYSVENDFEGYAQNTTGKLTKRRLKDGEVIWQKITPHPPNNQPVIGHGLVILPMGDQQMGHKRTSYIYAYDQTTGNETWVFEGPEGKTWLQAGDEELMEERKANDLPALCYPTPWSAPTLAKDGTLYIGNQEGVFFALNDRNGDGVVSGDEEVQAYRTDAGFSGSSSPAIAPGM